MSEARFSYRLVLGLGLASFLAGLLYFGQLSSSGSYPPNSSLRSDPAGSKLLFTALRSTGKVEVGRNYIPLELLSVRNSAILLLGVSRPGILAWNNAYLANLERLARADNRVVVGIVDDGSLVENGKPPRSAIENRWGIRVMGSQTADRLAKPFPPGSVTLLFHANRLNNDQLANHPESAALIPSVIDGKQRLLFDETHLGIAETGSVAALARRYRLEGLVFGLLLLAACFIWHQSRVFPPPHLPSPTRSLLAGDDGSAVLIDLMRRHISKAGLIALCISEWNRRHPKHRIAAHGLDGVEPVAAYRQIQNDLENRKQIRV